MVAGCAAAEPPESKEAKNARLDDIVKQHKAELDAIYAPAKAAKLQAEADRTAYQLSTQARADKLKAQSAEIDALVAKSDAQRLAQSKKPPLPPPTELPPPTKEQIKNADYGQPMSSKMCISIVERFIKLTLKDPASAQFEHDESCEKDFIKKSRIDGKTPSFGYIQRGAFNAKNSFGGYTGFKKYSSLIKNGAVIDFAIFNPKLGVYERLE